MFDTLKYSKILEAVGIPREHAEAHVKAYAQIVEDELVTKSDLNAAVSDLKHGMIELEYRLTMKVGTIVAVGMTIGIAVLTLILK